MVKTTSGRPTLRPSTFLTITALALLVSANFFSSCTPTCDYPSTRFARIRPVNAMPDQNNITIWLNGKQFQKDYSYDPPGDFGYYTQYEDGSPLPTGNITVTITSDAAGLDTLIRDTVIPFDLHKQSLIVIGRSQASFGEKETKLLVLLNDELQQPKMDTTFIRFLHAVPDMPSLDIFWTDPSKPDATIQYGAVNGYDTLVNFSFLKVTEAGNPNNVIVNFTNPVPAGGFVITAVIRGRSAAVGTERIPSVYLLSDIATGFIINVQTFGVRLFNASRDLPKLSLLIKSKSDSTVPEKGFRNNYPQQDLAVFDVSRDTVSKYLALRPELNGTDCAYAISTNHEVPYDIRDSFWNSAKADERYTFIGVEKALVGSPSSVLDNLVLRDTISSPANPAFNRIRIVHVNPDHPLMTVTLGSFTRQMALKGVSYVDVPVGTDTLVLTDGANTKTIPIPVASGRPMSLYLLPDQLSATFPVKIIAE